MGFPDGSDGNVGGVCNFLSSVSSWTKIWNNWQTSVTAPCNFFLQISITAPCYTSVLIRKQRKIHPWSVRACWPKRHEEARETPGPLTPLFICFSPPPEPALKAMAPNSSTLAWKILWTDEPGGLPSLGSHRVRHNWRDLAAAAARRAVCFTWGSNSSLQTYLCSIFMDFFLSLSFSHHHYGLFFPILTT